VRVSAKMKWQRNGDRSRALETTDMGRPAAVTLRIFTKSRQFFRGENQRIQKRGEVKGSGPPDEKAGQR